MTLLRSKKIAFAMTKCSTAALEDVQYTVPPTKMYILFNLSYHEIMREIALL